MNSKKHLFYVPLACFLLLLGACNNTGGGEVTPPTPTVSSITIKEGAEPQKEFTVGDVFTVAGGVLVVSYSDQTTKDVNMTLSMIVNAPDMTVAASSYTVNVLYEGARTSYNIAINEATVTVRSITIKEGSMPKQSYMVGDEFTVAGGTLIVLKSDDTRENVPMTLDMIENVPDMTVPHENYEVNVLYEGARTSYIINVIAVDTREEVTIGVSYDYNGGEVKDMVDGLNIYVGKSYHFYYGTNPEGAMDSTIYKYYIVTDSGREDLGSEKPEEVGSYIYAVILAEGDENYKPVTVEYNYHIQPTVNFVYDLNDDVTTGLTSEFGSSEIDYRGIAVKFDKAKLAENALATLEKGGYIEIATPTLIKDKLSVGFEGYDKYVCVYGSYDNEHYYLVDTLTRAKQETNRANDYFYFRLVANPIGEGNNDVTIKYINFSYEDDGAPETVLARAEYSDRFNHVSSAEDNAYFHRRTNEVFDAKYSSRSIGIRLGECSVRVDFGTVIPAREVKFYKVTYKFIPLEGVVYNGREDNGVYMKPVFGTTTTGKHLKWSEYAKHQTEWVTVEMNLIDFFEAAEMDPVDIDGLNVWLSAKCTEGCVVFDDFRLIQRDNYPRANALESITIANMTTEFERGDEFVFDGELTAYYTDGSNKVIPNDDSGISIVAPDMTTSGENKQVTISYTEDDVTKKAKYTINVTGTDPEAEETLTIIDEEHDLAKTTCQHKSGREYDCGKTRDNTTDTYGNSTNALDVYNLSIDGDTYINIQLPAPLVKDTVHIKFFAKNLPETHIYVQLMDVDNLSDRDPALQRALVAEGATKTSVETDQSSTYHFTATPAGNGWTMYEYDYYAANVTNGVNFIRFSTCAQLAADYTFILDGIEVR